MIHRASNPHGDIWTQTAAWRALRRGSIPPLNGPGKPRPYSSRRRAPIPGCVTDLTHARSEKLRLPVAAAIYLVQLLGTTGGKKKQPHPLVNGFGQEPALEPSVPDSAFFSVFFWGSF